MARKNFILDTNVLLHDPRSIGRVLYVNGGEEPIEAALTQVFSD